MSGWNRGPAGSVVTSRRAARILGSAVRGVERLEPRRLLAAVTVSGDIRSPGETDSFNFNFATPRRLYFDTLTHESRLRWSLNGPPGAVVQDRAFTSSDSADVSDPVVRVPAGSYTLAVDGQTDFTGGYQFRLLDLADATPITPGAITFNSLVPRNETDVYSFAAAAGDSFSFDNSVLNNLPNTYWRLIDPHGRVLFTQHASQDVPTVIAQSAGTYTLLLEGYVADTGGSGTYGFTVNFLGNTPPTPFTGTPLTVGATVNASIGTLGEIDRYTFTLASATRAIFDVLSDNPNAQWSLTGPGGIVVNARGFAGSDSYDFGASPELNLPAGAYRLDVSGQGGVAAGAYRFRLLDVAAATTAVTPGTPVSGTLSPGAETDVYTLTVAAPNTRLFFDATGTQQNTLWRLIDPFGQQVFSADASTDIDALTLAQPGTYRLFIEGYRNAPAAPAPYEFTVHPAPVTSTGLIVGAQTNGSIATPGETDTFAFNLSAPTKLAFDTLTDNGGLQWSLTGPGGVLIVNNRNFQQSDSYDFTTPFLNLSAGLYTLTVDGQGATTGGYAFRLLNYANATPFTPGTPVASTLTPGNETDLYRFDVASPNSKFFFNSSTSGPSASWRLIDPFDNLLFTNDISTDADTLTLAQPGTYFLAIEGYRNAGAAPANYSFNVQPVTVGTTPLVLGASTAGTIAVPGESDRYTFTLASNTKIAFDVLGDFPNAQWSLTGPGGVLLVNNRSLQQSDSHDFQTPFLNLPAGAYTLEIDGYADTTGAYGFRLLDYAAAAVPLTPGTPVSSTLDPATETDIHRFTVGAGGGQFYFNTDSSNPVPSASWRLIGPSDQVLFYSDLSTDVDTVGLGQAGVYYLVVEGHRVNGAGAGAYSFNVQPVTVGTAPLALGATVNGAIGVAGESDRYTFTLGAATSVAFDVLSDSVQFDWTLTGPGGVVVVDSRNFANSDSFDNNPVLRLPAGGYTLEVDASGDATGPYQFRLLDLASAAPIPTGTPVNATLSPGNSTNLHRFTVATAGDEFVFQSNSPSATASWRLIDPLGNFLFPGAPSLSSDQGPLALNVVGQYTLLVEGYRNNDSPVAYGFTVAPQGNTPPTPASGAPLTLGATVNGSIVSPGELDDYQFTLTGPTTVMLDTLVSDPTGVLSWRLQGPGGVVVTNRPFNASDSADSTDPRLTLPAGVYQLTVSFADGTSAGAYAFRLLDLSTGATLTPGTPVTGSLNPANETDVYRFAGTAAARVYFDVTERTGAPNASWRLIDPNGNVVFNNRYFGDAPSGDVDALALPLTGTYTLLVEGRYFEAGTGTYTLNVQPVTDSTTPVTVGATIGGAIAVPGERDGFTFTLGGASTLYFDSLTGGDSLRWTLTGPGGAVVTDRGFTGSDSAEVFDPRLNLPAGSYTLTVDAVGDATPAYAFELLDLSTGTAVTPGTPFGGTLDPASETDVFRFAGTAGARVYFDVQARTGAPSATWRLIDPNGNFVFNSRNFGDPVNGDVDALTLPLTGTYTLLIEGRYFDAVPGTYTVNLQPVADSSVPLALNVTTSGEIGVPGEQDSFTFTLGAASALYLDSLTGGDSLRWTLTGPGGVVANQRTYNGSDSADVFEPRLRLPAGAYTLTFDAVGDAVGGYTFRLLDPAAIATPITLGVPFSGTLAPAAETDAFTFEATAGKLLYFDVRARTGASNASWRLIDPNGNFVFNNRGFGDVSGDVDTIAAPLTGTYTLLIEGRYFDTGSGTYIVNVQPVGDGTLPFVAATGTFNVDQGPQHRLTLAFSQNVSASLQAGDFVLTRLSDGAVIPVHGVEYDTENNLATALLNTTLLEGNYRMRLVAAGITDAQARALDGDGDGESGGDYSFDFFYLPGDTNYDRKVDFNDLVALAQHYNKSGHTFTQGDFTYDGVVNFNDLVVLAQRYNFTLPPAPPAGGAASVASSATAKPPAATGGPSALELFAALVAPVTAQKPAAPKAPGVAKPPATKPVAKPVTKPSPKPVAASKPVAAAKPPAAKKKAPPTPARPFSDTPIARVAPAKAALVRR